MTTVVGIQVLCNTPRVCCEFGLSLVVPILECAWIRPLAKGIVVRALIMSAWVFKGKDINPEVYTSLLYCRRGRVRVSVLWSQVVALYGLYVLQLWWNELLPNKNSLCLVERVLSASTWFLATVLVSFMQWNLWRLDTSWEFGAIGYLGP